jgi:hypothetical protein
MNDYEVRRYDTDGNLLEVITAFVRLSYVRAENTVGAMTLTIPIKNHTYEDFAVNQVLEVWRGKRGSMELQNETAYFLRDWEFYSNRNGEHLIDLYGLDANFILETRIVAYASESAQSKMTDYADDMIKAIVTDNLGGDAVSARQLSTLTIAPELSASVEVDKGFAWRNLMGVCREIAETATESGTYTAFDVVRVGVNEFRLVTYTGQRGINHGAGSSDIRLVGEAYGNLSDAKLGTHHIEEFNYVYAGGQGQQDARIIQEASDTERINAGSPYNRLEIFHDARHCETTDSVSAEAESALRMYMPKKIISGNLVDTPGMQFGVHYGFGDIVSVQAFGHSADCHISSLKMDVDANNNETLNIKLRGEI